MRPALVASVLLMALLGVPLPAAAQVPVLRLLYLVSPDAAGGQGGRGIYVFAIHDGHKLVRKIDLPLKGTRGVCASAAAGRLWISHGDTTVLCVDLETDKVLWEKSYPRKDGCDRLCCTPDGKKVYVPSGTWSGSPEWKILDGSSGRELGRFRPHKSGGGHNAAVSLDGTRLFCASKANNFFAVVDTATDQVVAEVGPVGGGIHPFTVNAAGTLCFLNTGRSGVGFEVGDLRTGKILHQVKVPGLEDQKRLCHGIGLSPDEKEVWLNDQGQVHIFDVSGAAPRFVETVKLTGRAHGWTTFSIDGRFAYPDSGDVFDARTHKVVAHLTDQSDGKGKRVSSSKMIEVHFRAGAVVGVGDQFGLGRKAAAGAGARADATTLRKIAQGAAEARLAGGRFEPAAREQLRTLAAGLTDPQLRRDTEQLLPAVEQAAAWHARDRVLLAEVKRLGGKAKVEVSAPDWLRSIVGEEGLPVFGRLVEIDLNERTDGHKAPVPKKASDRVTDDWLKHLAGQDALRRLELSGTAITSAGLIHLKDLRNLEWLNVCLTALDDRGFEHLAGMTKMRRMVVCSSKITGTGFRHLQGMKQLESINLHSAPASDAGLEAIGKLTSLRRLEIVHTKVTDAGLKHLAGLVNLRQLHVHGPETTAAALPFLGQLKELDQLDVYDRAASNQTLEQIGKLPKLRLLMLVSGTFDDDGVRHLAKLTTLEELSLDSGKVTDASIQHLAGLRNLRKLDLGRTRITAAGRRRLKELLPQATISP